MVGPSTPETAYMLDEMAMRMGILSFDTMKAMMLKAPDIIPAQPHPCIARPKIRMGELAAKAQMTEPARNRAMEMQNTSFSRMV
jgi:hypothetical protein